MKRCWEEVFEGLLGLSEVGCSWQEGSRLAFETTGRLFKPPMSGLVFTMKKWAPKISLSRFFFIKQLIK